MPRKRDARRAEPADPAVEAPRDDVRQGCLHEVWSLLGSVRLAIALLILWAAGSVMGTLLPQSDVAPEHASALARALKLHDVYHSVWYGALLLMLSLSIVVCTVDRTRTTLRRLLRPRVRTAVPTVMRMSAAVQGRGDASAADLAKRAGRCLASRHYEVRTEAHEQGVDILARRGAWRLLGPMLVHVAVLMVFVGAIYGRSGWFGGYRNQALIEENGFYHEPHTDQYLKLDEFDAPFRPGEVAGSTVAVDYISHVTVLAETEGEGDEKVLLIPGSGDPDDPHATREAVVPAGSTLPEGMADGAVPHTLRRVREATIRVNHPLSSKGVGFYQQSWGVFVDLIGQDDEGKQATVAQWMLDGGESARGNDLGRLKLGAKPNRVVRLAVAEAGDNQAELVDGRWPIGPSIKIAVADSPEEAVAGNFKVLDEWLTPSHPVRYDDVEIRLERAASYTGLDVKRDPGVHVVMAGFIIGAIGLVLGFYVSDRRIRVKVTELKRGGSRLVAGADLGPDRRAKAAEMLEALVAELELTRE
jgi:cytochrome c biogenesis protein